jgi:hypothetical protein
MIVLSLMTLLIFTGCSSKSPEKYYEERVNDYFDELGFEYEILENPEMSGSEDSYFASKGTYLATDDEGDTWVYSIDMEIYKSEKEWDGNLKAFRQPN